MDKHFGFMIVVTAVGIFGGLGWGPYVPLLVYYFYAVIKPADLWKDASPRVRDVPWSMLVAVIAVLTAVIRRAGMINYFTSGPTPGGRKPVWNAVHWCLLAFAFWVCVCFAWATDRTEPRVEKLFVDYVKLFTIFAVASLIIYRVNQLWTLLAVLAAADVYVAFEMNVLYLHGWNRLYRQGFGGLDNNGAALMLAMGLPLLYFLWLGTREWWRWLFLLAAPVIAHAVMISFSRGAMLSCVLAAPVMFLLTPGWKNKKWFLLIAAVAAAFVVSRAGPELQKRFFSIEKHEVDESANERKHAWAMAVRMANDHPFTGLGLRNSVLFTKKYGGLIDEQPIHSTYLQMAADCGWLGMGLYLLLYGTAMWASLGTWRHMRKWPDHPEVVQARALSAGVFCSLLVFAIGAAFLSMETFELPYVLFMVSAQMYGVVRCGGVEALVRLNGSAPATNDHLPAAVRPMVSIPGYIPRPRPTAPVPANHVDRA